MATVATNVARMGKKRKIIRRRPVTPREQFAARLRELAGERTGKELAALWGVSVNSALKFLRGDAMPDMDRWQQIAESLGLDDWRDLLLPPS